MKFGKSVVVDHRPIILSLALAFSIASHDVARGDVAFFQDSGKRDTVLTLLDVDHIKITGPITRRDVQALSRALVQAKQYSLQRYGKTGETFVFLDSPGGNLLAAMEMGKLLREAPAWTGVFPGRECSSACVFVLAAGVRRFVSPGAQIGLHRPRFDPELFAALSQVKARELYSKLIGQCDSYLSRMGLPRELLQKMLKIPSHEARLINNREAEALGLDGEDPGYAEWARARLLKLYGEEGVRQLDRQANCLGRGLPTEQCQ